MLLSYQSFTTQHIWPILIYSSVGVYNTVESLLLSHWRFHLLALKLAIQSVASYPSIPHWLRWDIRHQAFLINDACGISGLPTCWIRIIRFLRSVLLKQCGKSSFWNTYPKTNAPYMFCTKFHIRPIFYSISSKFTHIVKRADVHFPHCWNNLIMIWFVENGNSL